MNDQVQRVATEIRKQKSPPTDARMVFDIDAEDKRFREFMFPLLLEGVVIGAETERRMFERAHGQKRSTATEIAEALNLDIDDIGTEIPAELLATARSTLGEIMRQPYWRDIQATADENFTRLLNVGVTDGWSIDRIAREVTQTMGPAFNMVRGRRIARTETTAMLNAGHKAEIDQLSGQYPELGMTSQWMSVVGQTTRPSHANLSGQQADKDGKWTLNGVKTSYPGSSELPAKDRINCFPGSTLVRGNAIGSQRAWYEGEIIEIVTRSGRRLELTPNHPVLTPAGMVPASKLDVGQHVISAKFEVDTASITGSGGDEQEHEPPCIAELHEAISLVDSTHASGNKLRRGTVDDFYGDAARFVGKIEVVNIEWVLGRKPERRQEIRDSLLRPELATSAGTGQGTTALRFGGVDLAPASVLSSEWDLLADVLRLTDPSTGLSFRHSLQLPNFLKKQTTNRGTATAIEPSDSGRGPAGAVFLDDIINVETRYFCGHVYDLQTIDGLIVAEGIVTSNCLCTVISSTADETLDETPAKPEAIKPAEEQKVDAATSSTTTGPKKPATTKELEDAGISADGIRTKLWNKAFGDTPENVLSKVFPTAAGQRRGRLTGQITGDAANGKISLATNIEDASGTKLATISREFTITDDGIDVYHDLLVVENAAQGKGIAKQIYESQFAFYEEIGATSVEIYANITVGGYSWARYGFLPDSTTTFKKAMSQAKGNLQAARFSDDITQEQFEELTEFIDRNVKNDNRKAIWALADDKRPIKTMPGDRRDTIGKRLLAGTSWTAKYNPTNPVQRARNNEYMGKK